MREFTDHFLFPASGRIHALAWDGGANPTVVCLHGVTSNCWSWMEFASKLPSRPVRALDLPGHGDSQWLAESDYETATFSDIVAQLLEDRSESVDIVGSSWGGLIGIDLAARYPHLVRSLVVIDIAPSSEASVADVPSRPFSFSDHASIVSWEREKSRFASSEMIEMLASYGYRPGEDQQLARKHDPFFGRVWPFRADDLWPALSSLEIPVLITRAQDSPVLTEANANRMADALPEGHLVEIDQTGHVVQVDNPTSLAAAVENFLSGNV